VSLCACPHVVSIFDQKVVNRLLLLFETFLTVTMGMKNNIFDRRRRSIYSTNNSTLPLVIQLQSEPRSCIKLFKLVNPTVSVYIIILCLENASNDTVTGLNWIPGIDKMDTYRTPARFPVFVWVLYQEHTFTDKRQNTRNQRQTRFLPLDFFDVAQRHGGKRARWGKKSQSLGLIYVWKTDNLRCVLLCNCPHVRFVFQTRHLHC